MSTHEGLTRIRFRFRNEPKIWKIPNYFSKIDRLKILNISPKNLCFLDVTWRRSRGGGNPTLRQLQHLGLKDKRFKNKIFCDEKLDGDW